MPEIWKEICGYNGLYEVSNYGNVKSLYNKKQKILKSWVANCSYRQVRLTKNKVQKTFWVHRLVAGSFLENKEHKPCVNHIDNNGLNNIVSNLEWVSYKENTQYILKQKRNNNRKGEEHSNSKLKTKDVLEIRGSILPNKKLAVVYKVSQGHIIDIKNNKSWSWLHT